MPEPGDPPRDCPLCPRLASFRLENRVKFPSYFNDPVPSFGHVSARLLIVGLAPGLNGANRTGRPFTGDYAGILLYETLLHFGFAHGSYDAHPHDELTLNDCRITNAARCVPPQNKPLPAEISTCARFLRATLHEMPNLAAVIALGRIAHAAVVRAAEARAAKHPFAHGGVSELRPDVKLFGCYHCSRYNTNTGRLTTEMFHAVFRKAAAYLSAESATQSAPC